MKNNNNIRIKDIARMAGVSTGTVDRVIHNRGNVSADAKKKIKTILKETNYSPNPIAQNLSSKKHCHIAVVLPHPQQDGYWELSNTGIKKAIQKWQSYNIHIKPYTFDLDSPDSFITVSRNVLQSQPDAVLTAPIFYEESMHFFQQLQQANIPYVLVNTEVNKNISKHGPLCLIGQDHRQSGRLGAELMQISLPEAGKVAVMHIHENVERSVHLREKEEGFRTYFEEQPDAGYEVSTYTFIDDSQSFEQQLSDCISSSKLKGIYVPTSTGALLTAKVLKALQKEDIVIIGYDLLKENIQYLTSGTINFLINQKPHHQAYQGLRYLVDHLLLHMEVPSSYLLPLQIVTRQNYASFMMETT